MLTLISIAGIVQNLFESCYLGITAVAFEIQVTDFFFLINLVKGCKCLTHSEKEATLPYTFLAFFVIS